MVIESQKMLLKYVSSPATHFFVGPDVAPAPTFCMLETPLITSINRRPVISLISEVNDISVAFCGRRAN